MTSQAEEDVHLRFGTSYDDGADEVRLYVDGRPGESAGRGGDFDSGGIFVVGRGLSGDEFFQGAEGTIDDVRAFGRALSPAEANPWHVGPEILGAGTRGGRWASPPVHPPSQAEGRWAGRSAGSG